MSPTNRDSLDPQEILRIAKIVAAVDDPVLLEHATKSVAICALMAIAQGGRDPESIATAALQVFVMEDQDLGAMLSRPVLDQTFGILREFAEAWVS